MVFSVRNEIKFLGMYLGSGDACWLFVFLIFWFLLYLYFLMSVDYNRCETRQYISFRGINWVRVNIGERCSFFDYLLWKCKLQVWNLVLWRYWLLAIRRRCLGWHTPIISFFVELFWILVKHFGCSFFDFLICQKLVASLKLGLCFICDCLSKNRRFRTNKTPIFEIVSRNDRLGSVWQCWLFVFWFSRLPLKVAGLKLGFHCICHCLTVLNGVYLL